MSHRRSLQSPLRARCVLVYLSIAAGMVAGCTAGQYDIADCSVSAQTLLRS
jgi:hypothetical protein